MHLLHVVPKGGKTLLYTCIYYVRTCALLLSRLPKLLGPSEQHWLGNSGNLNSSKETQP